MSKKKSYPLADEYYSSPESEPASTAEPAASSGFTVKVIDLKTGNKKPIYEVSGVASLAYAQNNLYSLTLVLNGGSTQTLMLADGWLVEQI
jgi:hypothetical protein